METVLLTDNGRHMSGQETTAGFAVPSDATAIAVEFNRAPLSAQGIGGLALRLDMSYDGGLTWPADYDYSGATQYPPGTPIAEVNTTSLKFNGFNLGPGNRPFNRAIFSLSRSNKSSANLKARVTTDTPVAVVVNMKLLAISPDQKNLVSNGRSI